MKNKILFGLSLLLCLSFAIFFISCDKADESSDCEHEWSESYQSNGFEHWRVCKLCDATTEVQTHTITESGHCEICDAYCEWEEIVFMLSDDEEGYLVRYGTCQYDIMVMPSEYNGKPVIGTFRYTSLRGEFEKVIIPKTFVSIINNDYGYPFTKEYVVVEDNPIYKSVDGVIFTKDGTILVSYPYLREDENYTIPNGVEHVQQRAFFECKLKNVVFPDGLKTIGDHAFSNTQIETVILPESITEISTCAFACSQLKNINLSSLTNLTEISSFVFQETKLEGSITIPDGVTYINSYAFYLCSSITELIIPDSVTDISTQAFVSCTSLTNVVLSDTLTVIKPYTFADCRELETVQLPVALEGLSTYAFIECVKLKSISISKNLIHFAGDSLNGCKQFQTIEVDAENPYFTSVDGVLYSKDLKSLVKYGAGRTETTFEIPSTVEVIETQAFRDNDYLTEITIPSNVKTIKDAAFCDCDSLTKVIVNDGVTHVGAVAFKGCWKLTDVEVPESLTFLGKNAFENCLKLNFNTYEKCNYLGNENNPYIVLYSTKDKWQKVTSIVMHEDSKVFCGTFITTNNAKIETVRLNDKIERIYTGAFYNWQYLTSIVIGSNVSKIDEWVFVRCVSLKSVYYNGDQESWNKISIGNYNYSLDTATVYFYSENQPVINGNYWYYDENGEVEVWNLGELI